MKRMMIGMVVTGILLTGLLLGIGQGAEMKVIQTHKAKDMVVTLLSESGQWTQGKNSFVLEFTSADTKQPVDVGKVDPEYQYAHAGHGADAGRCHADPGQDAGAVSRDDQLSR